MKRPGVEVGEQPVGARQDLVGRRARGGVHGGADLPHERGGVLVVALYVADGRGGRRVVEPDQVVEVAADAHAPGRRAGSGRPRPGRGCAGRVWGRRWACRLCASRSLASYRRARSRAWASSPAIEVSRARSSGVEGVRPVVGEDQRADGPSGDDQREEGPGGHRVAEARARGRRAPVRRRWRRSRGMPVDQHVRRGRARGQRGAVEAVHEAGRVPRPPSTRSRPSTDVITTRVWIRKAGISWSPASSITSWVADGLGERRRQVHQVVQRAWPGWARPRSMGSEAPGTSWRCRAARWGRSGR